MKYIKKFNTAEEVVVYDPFNLVLVADTDTVLYDVPILKGVFIQHVNGRLFPRVDWIAGGYSNDEANGVAIIDDACKFVIAKTDSVAQNRSWQATATLIEGISTHTEEANAITDFYGVANTDLMTNSNLKSFCTSYSFPNGKKGYVGAAGEWNLVLNKYSEVASALSAIGGVSISSKKYWTSTQYDQSKAWVCTTITNSVYSDTKTYNYYARAFTEI